MTIDEYISRCEKLASNYEFNLKMNQNNIMLLSVNDIERMKRYAQENRQLAEWLKELKAYQKAYEEIRKLPIVWEFGEGVIRCLTIIEDCLEEVNADGDSD